MSDREFEWAEASAAPPEAATDVAGRVEIRGIDVVPLEERHGEPRELFWLWLAANTSFIYILLGGLMVLIGLNIWQAILAVVIGNAFYLLIGIMGTPGPKAGTSTLIISRAQYGIHGNRASALLSWFNLVAFEAVNFSIGALALFALADWAGWHVGNGGKALLLAAVIIVTFLVAFLGHATIVIYQKVFAYGLIAVAIVLFIFVLPDVDWGYQPATPLSGGAALAVWLLGLTIIMSGPLSWCGNPADFTRYFRPEASPVGMTLWATFGCLIPAIFLSIIAVLAGTVVDMSDPATSMKELMPNWFYPLFLLVITFGTMCNNILGVYSSGLSLQSVGVPVPRWGAVLVDAVIGSGMTVYAVFISDFLTTLQEFLQFMVWWYAGFSAIFVVDLLLRRREYDGLELHRRGGRYWYDRGFNWFGLAALALAIIAAGAFANTTHWQSPIVTNYLDGADISALVGLVVGATSYWLLMRRRIGVPVVHPARAAAPGS